MPCTWGWSCAVLATVEVPAKGSGTAAFEIVHDPVLFTGEMVLPAVALAVGSEDGVDVERRRPGCRVRVHDEPRLPVHVRPNGGSDLCGDGIERRWRRRNQSGADMDVARRGANGGVTEQDLDDA